MASTADVRNLLKSERKARRIEHPHASYNTAGILNCRICHIQLKAESLWDQHLSGSHHRTMLQQRAQQQRQVSETAGRKRKAAESSDDEEDEGESRKKTKAEPQSMPQDNGPTTSHFEPKPTSLTPDIDEAEWAAFTRDVATPPPESRPMVPAVLASNATITAAPMSAEELAARSREEASTQAKERREAEMEGEKEDAARRMEEELEEMESLEERVRKLRERREKLRLERERPGQDTGQNDASEIELTKSNGIGNRIAAKENLKASEVNETEGEDDEDEDEDEDDFGWHLRR